MTTYLPISTIALTAGRHPDTIRKNAKHGVFGPLCKVIGDYHGPVYLLHPMLTDQQTYAVIVGRAGRKTQAQQKARAILVGEILAKWDADHASEDRPSLPPELVP